MMKDTIQTVTVILADGRRLRYSGPTQVATDEVESGNVRVIGVAISEPRPLPAGAQFEYLGGEDADPDPRGDPGDRG